MNNDKGSERKMAIVDNWNEIVKTTETYIKSSSLVDSFDKEALTRCIAKGNANPQRQSKMTMHIKSTVEDYEDSPFAVSRGYSLPDKAQEVISPLDDFRDAVAEAFDALGVLGQASVQPHGRSNYDFYTDGAQFASTIYDKAVARMTSLHKSGDWNGNKTGLKALLTSEGQ